MNNRWQVRAVSALVAVLLLGGLAACSGWSPGSSLVRKPAEPVVQEKPQTAVIDPGRVVIFAPAPVLESRPAGPPPAPTEAGEKVGLPGFRYLVGDERQDEPTPEELLGRLAREVAGKVYYGLLNREEGAVTARVAVVAAVPLADLKRDSEFGRVLAEYLLTDLADRGLPVTELRLGRDIHIVPQTGEFILSRNIGELAGSQPPLDYVVVSTYSNTRRTLLVYGRLVDLRDGRIKSSWRHTLPLSRELIGLFEEGREPHTVAVRGIM